jgi:hypothetical protein
MVCCAGYPFGRGEWSLMTSPCLEAGQQREVMLDLSRCGEWEFPCSDSTACIDLELKCDGKRDCKDNSDELVCARLLPGDSETPPPRQEGLRTGVTVRLEVISIVDINESNEFMRVQAHLSATWRDPRLTLLNLNHDDQLNLVAGSDRAKLWFPSVVLANTEARDVLSVDNDSVVTVGRAGPSTLTPHSHLDSSLSFEGEQNPLTASSFIVRDFLCTFSLSLYPFDTQTCSVDIAVATSAYMVVDPASTAE